MSAVDLAKKPARVSTPSCPAWCVRDHADETDVSDWRRYHHSEFARSTTNAGFVVVADWIEYPNPTEHTAQFDRSEVSVTAGGGLLNLSRRDALALATILDTLDQEEPARLVREAADLIEGIGGVR